MRGDVSGRDASEDQALTEAFKKVQQIAPGRLAAWARLLEDIKARQEWEREWGRPILQGAHRVRRKLARRERREADRRRREVEGMIQTLVGMFDREAIVTPLARSSTIADERPELNAPPARPRGRPRAYRPPAWTRFRQALRGMHPPNPPALVREVAELAGIVWRLPKNF
jgi:hypothetical protein